MTFVMANGLALEQLLEPDAVPDEMYGKMLYAFFLGLKAMEAQVGADRLDQERDANRAASA